MNKIFLVVCALFFVTIAGASADLTTNLVSYWKADNAYTDSTGFETLADVGGVTFTTGKINEAFTLDGTNDYVRSNARTWGSTNNWTYAFWVYRDVANNAQTYLRVNQSTGGNANIVFAEAGSTNYIRAGVFNSAGAFIKDYTTTTTSIGAGSWHHVVLSYDGDLKVYVNGVLQSINVTINTTGSMTDVSRRLSLGSESGGGNFLDGKIDEVGFWNTTLTASEASQLYNGGAGLSYPFNTAPQLRIYVNNAYKGWSVNSFNATVQWNGSTYNYTTTTGNITTSLTVNSSLPANISVFPNGYYFQNLSFTNWINESLTANATPWANITAYNINGGANLTTFNVTYNGSTYNATTGSVQIPVAYNYDINVSSSLYLTNTTSGTVPELLVGLYPWATIRAYDAYNGTNLTSFNVTYNGTLYTTTNSTIQIPTALSYTYNATLTNYFTNTSTGSGFAQWVSIFPYTLVRAYSTTGTSIANFTANYTNNANSSEAGSVTTTNNITYLPLYNGVYTVTVYDANNNGVNYATDTENLTANLYLQAYNFSLFLSNSLFITFVDETTGNVINTTTITAYLTGDAISYNYSTTNGYLNATLISPQPYVITYGGSGYATRQYIIELENQTAQSLSLYLLNNSTGTYIRFTVLDQTYQTLEGATIDAQKKNLSGTNYYTVADCSTDNNGECILFLETLTSTYRFVTDYESTTRTTSDTILSRDTYTIVLNIGSSTLQSVLGRDDITANLNYTPVGSFYYVVNDETGNVQQGLLEVQRRYGGQWTTIASETTTGSSFTLTVTGVNVTLGDEIRASGYVYVDGQPILTHQVSVIEREASELNGGLVFLFLGMMFTIVFIFAWNPVAPLAVFGAFVLIMSRVGIIAISTPAVVAFIVVIGIAIYRMRSV